LQQKSNKDTVTSTSSNITYTSNVSSDGATTVITNASSSSDGNSNINQINNSAVNNSVKNLTSVNNVRTIHPSGRKLSEANIDNNNNNNNQHLQPEFFRARRHSIGVNDINNNNNKAKIEPKQTKSLLTTQLRNGNRLSKFFTSGKKK